MYIMPIHISIIHYEYVFLSGKLKQPLEIFDRHDRLLDCTMCVFCSLLRWFSKNAFPVTNDFPADFVKTKTQGISYGSAGKNTNAHVLKWVSS